MTRFQFRSALLLTIFTVAGARAATPILVNDAAGKKLLEMDDPALGHAYQEISVDGKAVLYVEGNHILKTTHDAPLLVVDDNDVRPGGVQDVILARFDGNSLRHGKAVEAPILMTYQHPDLCPTPSANRVYRIEGPQLNHAQLVAVLYALKPELFTLSDAETAAQKKAYADAGAESNKEAAKDHVAMKWTVLNGHGPLEHINQGAITFAEKKNDAYATTLDYTPDGGAIFNGVAVAGSLSSGGVPLWLAFGPPKTAGLCVYKIDGAKLTGTWHTFFDDGTVKSLGIEELSGPAVGSPAEFKGGNYKITAAHAPFTGVAYTGTVSIKPLQITGADDSEKPFAVTWTIGGATIQGIAIQTDSTLYVASGTGGIPVIAKAKIANGTMTGDFLKLGATEAGGFAATN